VIAFIIPDLMNPALTRHDGRSGGSGKLDLCLVVLNVTEKPAVSSKSPIVETSFF
jgi:hypothetical protein